MDSKININRKGGRGTGWKTLGTLNWGMTGGGDLGGPDETSGDLKDQG